jgi:hypothetical protein
MKPVMATPSRRMRRLVALFAGKLVVVLSIPMKRSMMPVLGDGVLVGRV